MTEEFDLSFRN